MGKTACQSPLQQPTSDKCVTNGIRFPRADRPDLAMEQDVLMTMDPATGASASRKKDGC